MSAPMSHAGVTEVAQLAKVSIATVSRVVNEPEKVAESTRERVLTAMKQLDFRVNTAASSLRRGHAKTIAIAVASMSQPWYVKLLRSLRAAITERGYGVLIYDLEHRTDVLLDYLAAAPHHGVSGMVLATGDHIDTPETISALQSLNARMPLVVIGQHLEAATWATIQFDDVKASMTATNLLLASAPGRVCFLGRNARSYLADRRLEGFRIACQAAGVDPEPLVIDLDGFEYQSGFAATTEILRDRPGIGAVFCVNDELALGSLRAAAKSGRRVPEEFQVLGFGDTDFLEFVTPSLSSVGGLATEVSRHASKELWAALDGEPSTPLIVLSRQLQLRESTGTAVV